MNQKYTLCRTLLKTETLQNVEYITVSKAKFPLSEEILFRVKKNATLLRKVGFWLPKFLQVDQPMAHWSIERVLNELAEICANKPSYMFEIVKVDMYSMERPTTMPISIQLTIDQNLSGLNELLALDMSIGPIQGKNSFLYQLKEMMFFPVDKVLTGHANFADNSMQVGSLSTIDSKTWIEKHNDAITSRPYWCTTLEDKEKQLPQRTIQHENQWNLTPECDFAYDELDSSSMRCLNQEMDEILSNNLPKPENGEITEDRIIDFLDTV